MTIGPRDELRGIFDRAGVSCPPSGPDAAALARLTTHLHSASDFETLTRALTLASDLEIGRDEPAARHLDDQAHAFIEELLAEFDRVGLPRPSGLLEGSAFEALGRELGRRGDVERAQRLVSMSESFRAGLARLEASREASGTAHRRDGNTNPEADTAATE